MPKISDEDLSLLYRDADHDRLAAEWLAAGVALVVVTRRGADLPRRAELDAVAS